MGGLALRWSWRCPWWCSQFRTQFQSYARILVCAVVVSTRTWCTAQLTACMVRQTDIHLLDPTMLFSSPVYLLLAYFLMPAQLSHKMQEDDLWASRAWQAKPRELTRHDPFSILLAVLVVNCFCSFICKKVNDVCLLVRWYLQTLCILMSYQFQQD